MNENSKIKVIKGIGVLLILSDKENEMLKSADLIKNVGCLVIKESFYSKYPRVALKNIGGTVIVPDDAETATSMGLLNINQGYLRSLAKKIHVVALGAVMVAHDTDAELFAEKIEAIHLAGVAVCPESLSGAVGSVLKGQMGITMTYPDGIDAQAKVENGNLTLNQEYLEALNDNTVLIANGNLLAVDKISRELAEAKLLKIVLNGRFIMSHENQKLLMGKSSVNGQTLAIPEGYEYVGESIEINENNIETYGGRNLFVKGNVMFDDSLSSEEVEQSGLSIMCKKAVFSKKIEKQVASILKGEDTVKIAYSGELVTNDGKRIVTEKELKYVKSPLHILNFGEMKLKEDITDDLFYEKISGIHNYGSIVCSDELYGLVQTKMKQNEGSLETCEEASKEKPDNEIVLISGLGKVDL